MVNDLDMLTNYILLLAIAGLTYFISFKLLTTKKILAADAIAIIAVIVAMIFAERNDSIVEVSLLFLLSAVIGIVTFGIGKIVRKGSNQKFPVLLHLISIVLLICITVLVKEAILNSSMKEIVLGVTDAWIEDDLELRLEKHQESRDLNKIFIDWSVKNKSEQTKVIVITPDNFSAMDNLGNQLLVVGIGPQTRMPTSELKIVLEPAEEEWFWLAIQYDVVYSSAREVTIIASEVSSIEKAKWEILAGYN